MVEQDHRSQAFKDAQEQLFILGQEFDGRYPGSDPLNSLAGSVADAISGRQKDYMGLFSSGFDVLKMKAKRPAQEAIVEGFVAVVQIAQKDDRISMTVPSVPSPDNPALLENIEVLRGAVASEDDLSGKHAAIIARYVVDSLFEEDLRALENLKEVVNLRPNAYTEVMSSIIDHGIQRAFPRLSLEQLEELKKFNNREQDAEFDEEGKMDDETKQLMYKGFIKKDGIPVVGSGMKGMKLTPKGEKFFQRYPKI